MADTSSYTGRKSMLVWQEEIARTDKNPNLIFSFKLYYNWKKCFKFLSVRDKLVN